MKRSSTFGLALVCALILTILTGCSTNQQATEKETRISSVEHITGHGLKVRSHNGNVAVRHRDRQDVQITAHLRTIDETRLAETKIIAQRDSGGMLDIHVDWPNGKRENNESCSFEVLIPDATHIELTSSNGKVIVGGIGSDAVLTTSNGAIEVTDLSGPVKARTSNGAIKLTNVTGQIEAKTSNGKIQASQVAAPFTLNTSNGGITIELKPDFSSEVDLRTSNGNINVTGLQNARLISSGDHRMRLGLGDQMNESIAHTSNGKITLRSVSQ